MNVLVYLAQRPGETVRHDKLLSEFWRGPASATNAVHKAVNELRRALSGFPDPNVDIETVPKRGYRLEARTGGTNLRAPLLPEPTEDAVHSTPLANGATPDASLKSIAVMRFRAREEQPHAYLGESIAIALLTNLSKAPTLRVTDREIAFRHSIARETIQVIGKTLGVQYALDGAVQEVGDQIRVSVSLYASHSAELIYAYTHQETLDRILVLQNKVIADVLSELKIQLDDERRADMQDWGTKSIQAYLATAEANSFFKAGADLRTLTYAESRFRDAIALDPGFLAAYSQLSNMLSMHAYETFDSDQQQAFREENARLCEIVSHINPQSDTLRLIQINEARLSSENMWAKWEAELRAQIQCIGVPRLGDGHYSSLLSNAYLQYSYVLMTGHLFREAERFLDIIERFHPDDPWIAAFRSVLVTITQGAESALPLCLEVVRTMPNQAEFVNALVNEYSLSGQFDEAERYLKRLRDLDNEGVRAYASWLYLSLLRGDLKPGTEEFRRAAEKADEFTGGLAYLMVGDVESGLQIWRRRKPNEQEIFYRLTINAEQYVPSSVINDPRYQEYLDEVGIGRRWTEFLRTKVAELAPITGVELSDPTPQLAASR